MAELSDFLPGTERPFTPAMADDLGISRRQLYGPRFRSVIRGVFVDRRIPDSLVVRARAVELVLPPGGTFSHYTAACLWSATATRSSQVHVSFTGKAQLTRKEIRTHQYTYLLERRMRHGLPVTSPEMTFMHLAVHLDLVGLVAFGDQLVKRGVTTPDQLKKYAHAWPHQGRTAGGDAAEFVRDRVESVPETDLRLLLVLSGLPEPEVNYSIRAADGEELARLDLAYPQIKLAVEYDGRWHDEPEQRAKDGQRRRWLRSLGWTIIVVRAEGLYETPELTLCAVAEALTVRGVRLEGGLSEEYRRYFGRLTIA